MRSLATTLLLGSALADVSNYDDGTAGPAPCAPTYLAVCGECNSKIGEDPHAVHGIEANDGGMVAAGFSMDTNGSGKKDGFVIKTKGGCTYSQKNLWLT